MIVIIIIKFKSLSVTDYLDKRMDNHHLKQMRSVLHKPYDAVDCNLRQSEP